MRQNILVGNSGSFRRMARFFRPHSPQDKGALTPLHSFGDGGRPLQGTRPACLAFVASSRSRLKELPRQNIRFKVPCQVKLSFYDNRIGYTMQGSKMEVRRMVVPPVTTTEPRQKPGHYV